MVALELEAAEVAETAALEGGGPLDLAGDGRQWLVGAGTHAAIGDFAVHGYRTTVAADADDDDDDDDADNEGGAGGNPEAQAAARRQGRSYDPLSEEQVGKTHRTKWIWSKSRTRDWFWG